MVNTLFYSHLFTFFQGQRVKMFGFIKLKDTQWPQKVVFWNVIALDVIAKCQTKCHWRTGDAKPS